MGKNRTEPSPSLATDRRGALQRLWALAALGSVSCGGGGGSGGAAPSPPTAPSPGPAPAPAPAPAPVPAPAPGAPALGAHDLVYHRNGVSVAPLPSSAMTTRASGSTLLACVGRGVQSSHRLPTDNKGNAFVQIGSAHTYTNWPTSGTALYGCLGAAGGAGHVVTAAKPDPADETTLSVVEIAGGGVLADVQWREVLRGSALTSPAVTTRGPALLVAWWWGDADVNFDKTAVPDNGFSVIDAILLQGALVQCAVAVRAVSAAGTYQTTWVATPAQGAQLWIAAVEAA